MLTLFDVPALCEDEEGLQEWLRSYGVFRVKATKCVNCGSSMKDCVYRGKPHVVCSDQKCRAKVSDVVGGLLEGYKLSYKQFSLLVYWWAHECGGERAENMLGLDGTWGRLKNWIRAKGGVDSGHLLGYDKQWRRNIGSADPFLTVMEHIRDGHFQ